jgi:serine protease Do
MSHDSHDQAARIRQIHDQVAPAVVRIGRHGGRGCGFIAEPGIVVTNAHNLRDETTEVGFADGRATQARALAIDPDEDLVALQVDTGDATPLTWAAAPPQLGDPVFSVVRLPGGTRITSGTVSSIDRSFRGPRGRRITGGVEHTAPLARGSSGSPLVDAGGGLVGISALRLGDGFSIALSAGNGLRSTIDELRAGRTPRRRMLGVALAPPHVSRRLRRSVGLPDRDGLLVRHVEAGSPAERAGLRTGDLITAAGEVDVTSVDDVAAIVDGLPDGTELRLHIIRGSDDLVVVVPFDDNDASEQEGET